MSSDAYITTEIRWDDVCQGIHSAQCRKKPMIVVVDGPLWRWPLCREHRWHVEGSDQ